MAIDFTKAFETETYLSEIIRKQVRYGVKFDLELAYRNVQELTRVQDEAYATIRPFLKHEIINLGEVKKIRLKSGKYIASLYSYFKDDELIAQFQDDKNIIGGVFTRIAIEEPELSKRGLIVQQLLNMGWKPLMFTPTGLPKITDKGIPCSSLEAVGTFGKALALYYTASHRKSQIEGLIKLVRSDGRIEADMDTMGTNTARCRHIGVVNIPRPSSFFGKEMRSMFCVGEGRVLVGSDASGLELRCLAHYMNDPDYVELILHGDIHEFNREVMGLATRNIAKSVIYCTLYGGGIKKIGETAGGSQKDGKRIQEALFSGVPTLKNLIDKCKRFGERDGHLPLIDGRKVILRKFEGRVLTNTALNSLLQGTGSVLVKNWLVEVNKEVERRGLDAHQVLFVHDEVQFDCHPSVVEELTEILHTKILEVGKFYNLKIPLACDVKVGKNWYDTH